MNIPGASWTQCLRLQLRSEIASREAAGAVMLICSTNSELEAKIPSRIRKTDLPQVAWFVNMDVFLVTSAACLSRPPCARRSDLWAQIRTCRQRTYLRLRENRGLSEGLWGLNPIFLASIRGLQVSVDVAPVGRRG